MDTVNEHTTDPLTQVTDLLTLFLDLFATDSIGGEDTEDALAQGLEQYMAQVDSLATTVEACGDRGLYHVCVHYRTLLATFANATVLSEEVRVALEEWPTLVMTYLEDPSDADICAALIEHLQSPVWATPLSCADAETLLHLLVPSAAANPDPSDTPETFQEDALSLPEVQAAVLPADIPYEPVLVQDTSAAAGETWPPALLPELPSELPLDAMPVEPVVPLAGPADTWAESHLVAGQDSAVAEDLAVSDRPLLDDTTVPASPVAASCLDDAVLEAEFPALADPAGPESLPVAVPPALSTEAGLEHVASDPEDEALAAALPMQAFDLLVSDVALVSADEVDNDYVPEITLEHEAAEMLVSEPDPVPAGLPEPVVRAAMGDDAALPDGAAEACDATTASLLALLCQEVMQLAETLAEGLTDTAMASDEWRQVLMEHSEELVRFGDGAASMGLHGLQQASAYLCANLVQLSAQETELSDAQCQVVRGWPTPVLSYIQRRSEPEIQVALVQYLTDTRWPAPLSEAEQFGLLSSLQHLQLLIEDAEPMPERQREAQLEDISLTLPVDVSPSLLETLLQELPQQAAEFSAAVQRLATGTGTLADVAVAQRIAHSLKGAANTVGVPGVANLTHHLEDILLAFAEQEMLPTRSLSRTLTSAADCLEAMSEAMSGSSEAPSVPMTLGVLQEVLDWANLIDAEGVPSDESMAPPARDTLPGLLEGLPDAPMDTAVPSRSQAATAGHRLDMDLVDGLLRLSGEGMILNGQLQDRLRRTVTQSRAVRAQNTLVQQLVWELEQLVDVRGVSSAPLQNIPAGEFDPLELEQYNEMHTITRRLLEAVTDALATGQEVDGSLAALDGLLHDQRRVQRESDETIMRTRMVPAQTIAPRLQRSVRQACRLTGKDAEFVLSGGETLVDSAVLSSLLDPLMHMLRNAVDHGIEPPEARVAQGKPRAGSIRLACVREGNTLVLRCQDDGAGLNYEAIQRTALARGLLDAQATPSEETLGRLIFQAGFSTRTQTTQMSGRGIGMDVVYSRLQELKGSLRLTSEAGQGCLIEIRLPVSLLSTHGLLVRSGTQVFAISDLGVEQILYPAAGTLGQDGDHMFYELEGESLEARSLETLLHLRLPGDAAPLAGRPALLVRDETGQRHVVLVQAVLDSLPLVIKPLGRYVPPIPGLAGATILGDGSAAAVLDLPGLLRISTPGSLFTEEQQEALGSAESARPVALVVDDSLSARRALADFVEDLGFEVHTAGDGLEAIASMARRLPALLLVDLEMPRMNGLELAEHVRVQHAAQELPIIMLTSRSTEKHRRSAERAGVNVYLVKPFVEDTMAEHIHQLMEWHSAAVGGS